MEQQQWIFVGGPPRSGTTILSWVLSQHPEIEILRETHFGTDMVRLLSAADSKGIINVPHCASRLHLGRICNVTNLDEYDVTRAFAQELRGQVAPEANFFGDKSPQYARDWPMLRNIFPGCRMIFTDRETYTCANSIVNQKWGAQTIEQALPIIETFRAEMHGCDDAFFVTLERLNDHPRDTIMGALDYLHLDTATYDWGAAIAQINCEHDEKVN